MYEYGLLRVVRLYEEEWLSFHFLPNSPKKVLILPQEFLLSFSTIEQNKSFIFPTTYCVCIHEIYITVIDNQVRLVQICKRLTSLCFFVKKRTNDKLTFVRLATGKRIKENCLGFRFPFIIHTLYYRIYI
jgi:hypothetical protein